MDQLSIVKVGGAVLEEAGLMNEFISRFVSIPGLKILIHGGGRSATRMAEMLNVETLVVEGRRITDSETLKIVTMVYGGLVNKQTVAALHAKGCNAIGLTGADMNLIQATKRPVKEIDYGFVGDIVKVNIPAFKLLLENTYVPVIASLTHDGQGNLLNTNADNMASAVAIALAKLYNVKLVFCFEKKGVLADPDNNDSVIPVLNSELYLSYQKSGTIHSGMIPKLDNSFNALKNGVKEVTIINASDLNTNKGTQIVL